MPYIQEKKVEKPQVQVQQTVVEDNSYIAQRRSICNACAKKNPFNETCMECGCPILELNRNKARKCPIGKW